MNKELAQASVGGVARHLGTLVAGALVANGWVGEDMAQTVVGVVSGALVVAWSVWQKREVQVRGGQL